MQMIQKDFYLNKVFLQAMNHLQPFFKQPHVEMEFIRPNTLRVNNWDQNDQKCRKWKDRFDRVLDQVNVMKVNQSEKKIERIRNMKKWRMQCKIQGLGIMRVKKNFGNIYYLVGFGSHQQIYSVLKNLQSHSYKSFPSTLLSSVYKPVISLLTSLPCYEILSFSLLHITSTQIHIITSATPQKRSYKTIQFLFELDKYTPSKLLIDGFKKMLVEQFEAFVFVVKNYELHKVMQSLNKVSFDGIKLKETKNDTADLIVVCRTNHAKQKLQDLTIIANELQQYIQEIRLFKGIGKTYQLLKSFISAKNGSHQCDLQKQITQNYIIQAVSIKNTVQLRVKRSERCQKWGWIKFFQKIL